MSQTACYRCGNVMAASFPVCPHCGALQDEESRAAGRRRNLMGFLIAMPAGLLGVWVGWSLSGSFEWTAFGGVAGFVGGLALGAFLYDRAKRHQGKPPRADDAEPRR